MLTLAQVLELFPMKALLDPNLIKSERQLDGCERCKVGIRTAENLNSRNAKRSKHWKLFSDCCCWSKVGGLLLKPAGKGGIKGKSVGFCLFSSSNRSPAKSPNHFSVDSFTRSEKGKGWNSLLTMRFNYRSSWASWLLQGGDNPSNTRFFQGFSLLRECVMFGILFYFILRIIKTGAELMIVGVKGLWAGAPIFWEQVSKFLAVTEIIIIWKLVLKSWAGTEKTRPSMDG